MTDAINANNRVKTHSPATEQRAKSAPTTSDASRSSQASAVVELSSDQLLGQMDRVPEVNSSRIESIKNALAKLNKDKIEWHSHQSNKE